MKKRQKISWVHISDIHYGHTNYVEAALRSDLLTYLQALKEKYHFDLLIITGDLVFAKVYNNFFKETDIKKIRELVKGIQDSVGVDNNHTCIAIGNHDVLRLREKGDVVKKILSGYRAEADKLSEPDNLTSILTTEYRFKDLHEQLLMRSYIPGHSLFTMEIPHEEKECKIHVLNIDTTLTAEAMVDGNKILQDGNLRIGISSLNKTLLQHCKDDCPIIAIGHHPLEAIADDDRSLIIRELENAGVRLYLCGHTHKASIRRLEGSDIIQACCGTNMECLENGSKADMTFFVGTMDIEEGSFFVQTHEYIHSKQDRLEWKVSSDAPFDQCPFERNLNQTTFCYPVEMAPYYILAEEYVSAMKKIIENDEFYVEPTINENKRYMPSGLGPESRKNIYEADLGYGKSMFLKNIAKKALTVGPNQDILKNVLQDNISYPFYIDLESKKIKSSVSNDIYLIYSLLAESINLKKSSKDLFFQWINYIAKNGKLILLIDGVDQLDENKRQVFSSELNKFCENNSNIEVYITSKYFVFESPEMVKKYSQFTFYEISPFDEGQIREYCEKWIQNNTGYENKVQDNLERNKNNLIEQIIKDDEIKDLAKVPLLLNITMQVSQKTQDLPRNRIQLYDSFVRALLKNGGGNIDSDLRVLAAIAYQMIKKGYSNAIQEETLKNLIGAIFKSCDWFCTQREENACEFCIKMYTMSGLLRKTNTEISFYNSAIQGYFASMAIAKGWDLDLKGVICEENAENKMQTYWIQSINPFLQDIDRGNLLELTILQLNSYQTYIVVNKMIELINDPIIASSTMKSSYLRNLLLRFILDGAFICKTQRERVFEAIQANGLFSLQADLLWEVWNSNYKCEFEDACITCNPYFATMFNLLQKVNNPIQTLCKEINNFCLKLHQLGEETLKTLDEKLYVLDGIIWSSGRKYIDEFLSTNRIEELISIIESILHNDAIDALCKRRTCGVLQRLIEIGSIKDEDIKTSWIDSIFNIYATMPNVLYRKKNDLDDDKYAGIRVFRALPLTRLNVQTIKKMKHSLEEKSFYITLFNEAGNVQDKLDAFAAAILCRNWEYNEIQDIIVKDEVFKDTQTDMSDFNDWLNKLNREGFFKK